MSKTDKILNVGCGNSRLSEELYEDGFEDITNIDFSKIMDVLDMKEIQTGSFNIVFDKATLDSILCGDNSGSNAQKMISEIHRVLAPGGRYICITYGDPEHRKKYFETQQWSNLSVDKMPKPNLNVNNEDNINSKNYHYIYVMKK